MEEVKAWMASVRSPGWGRWALQRSAASDCVGQGAGLGHLPGHCRSLALPVELPLSIWESVSGRASLLQWGLGPKEGKGTTGGGKYRWRKEGDQAPRRKGGEGTVAW